jgi:5'-3' exonuclease
MGIHQLNKILKKHSPEAFQEVHISKYAFKKVAIDISLYVCKFKAVCGDRWMAAFINLVTCLRKNEVHGVFVYDTGAPPEKAGERDERAAQREKSSQRITDLESGVRSYLLNGSVSECLLKASNKINLGLPKRLLSTTSSQRVDVPIPQINDLIAKKKSQQLSITPADFELTRKLFDILKVPHLNAPLEAETTCVDLCLQGEVDAVLTEDTDVLAYQVPVFLSKINTGTGMCTEIVYDTMLEELKLKSDEFLDMCIMCGTDYNKNIKGMGPVAVFNNITKHSSIEQIGAVTGVDISTLKHKRGRELFREYEKVNYKVPYCGRPDFNALEDFVESNNIRCNVSALKRHYVNDIKVVFDGDDYSKLERVTIVPEEE